MIDENLIDDSFGEYDPEALAMVEEIYNSMTEEELELANRYCYGMTEEFENTNLQGKYEGRLAANEAETTAFYVTGNKPRDTYITRSLQDSIASNLRIAENFKGTNLEAKYSQRAAMDKAKLIGEYIKEASRRG